MRTAQFLWSALRDRRGRHSGLGLGIGRMLAFAFGFLARDLLDEDSTSRRFLRDRLGKSKKEKESETESEVEKNEETDRNDS